jgi:hypothetical protein
MCGIAGLYRGAWSNEALGPLLERMSRTLVHRGPDELPPGRGPPRCGPASPSAAEPGRPRGRPATPRERGRHGGARAATVRSTTTMSCGPSCGPRVTGSARSPTARSASPSRPRRARSSRPASSHRPRDWHRQLSGVRLYAPPRSASLAWSGCPRGHTSLPNTPAFSGDSSGAAGTARRPSRKTRPRPRGPLARRGPAPPRRGCARGGLSQRRLGLLPRHRPRGPRSRACH